MATETVHDDEGRAEEVYVKEEPTCIECNDSGRVLVFPFGGGVETHACAECYPSVEELARRATEAEAQAEYLRRVQAGELVPSDEEPF